MFISFVSKLKNFSSAFYSSDRISFNLAKVFFGLYPLPKSPIFGNSSSLYSSCSKSTWVVNEESLDLISLGTDDDANKVYREITDYPYHKSPKFEDSYLENNQLVDRNSVGSSTSGNAGKVYERITEYPLSKSPKFEDPSLETTSVMDTKSPNLITFGTNFDVDKQYEEITERPFPKSPIIVDSCIESTCLVDEASNSSSTNSDADKLYNIINEPSNYPNLEKVLVKVSVQLTTTLVIEVLHRLRYEEKMAFKFFTWAAHQEFYSHEPQVYNEMIDILSSTKYKVKQFGIVCDLLDYMKRNDKKKSVPIEVLLTILRKYTEKHLTHLRKFAKKKRINLKISPEIDALNLLLDAFCKCCLVKHAETMLYKVQNKVKPNAHTYNIMFFGWCRVRNPTKAMGLLEDMIKMGFTPESFTYNTAIDTFCREGMVTEAIDLLEFMKNKGSTMSSPTAKTYSVVIVALVQNNRLDECFKLMENMISSGCLPDVSTYKELIEGMCCAGKTEAAYKLLEVMGNKGYPPDIVTYNCFLKVLCDQKNGDEAMKLYRRMIAVDCKPSVHTFDMLITMFFEMGDPNGAFDTWDEMEKRRCARDTSTYCLMIDGLFGCDSAKSACFLLEDVVNNGMKLPYEKFNSFMQKLAEIGDLQAIHRLSEHARKFYNPAMARRFALNQKRRSMSLRGK